MLTFVSIPYSNNPTENMETLYEVSAELIDMGYDVISPMYIEPAVKISGQAVDWNRWKSYAERLMMMSESVIVIKNPGWDASEGVAGEIDMARSMGLTIKYVDPDNVYDSF